MISTNDAKDPQVRKILIFRPAWVFVANDGVQTWTFMSNPEQKGFQRSSTFSDDTGRNCCLSPAATELFKVLGFQFLHVFPLFLTELEINLLVNNLD